MRVERKIGAVSIIIGLGLMATGQQLCRTSCWFDNLFKLVLPRTYESLAGGLPWLVIGIALTAHEIWKRPKN